MIRLIVIIFFIFLVSVYTVFDMVITFFVSLFSKESVRRHSVRVVKLIFRVGMLISGVRVHVAGRENMIELSKREKSFFAISNHRGFFDTIIGYLLFDKGAGIVAKNSLEKIPVISYWMKRIDCIFLDRNDIRDGIRMVLKAIENINNGITMWLFPEGTRCVSEDKTAILEFKAGAFKIAEKADCYILPISFRNTECVFENQIPLVRPADIYINIGSPYKMSELQNEERKDIAKYSEQTIKKLLMEDAKWQKL